MSVKNLEFGYNGYVAVQDMQGRELYRRPIQSDHEIEPWIKANKPSVAGWDVLKSSFVPVRVDNLADFARDLFLPTFVNHALKIHNVCLKILASCLAIVWDVFTLPIRCITWPVRLYCYHYRSKPLPVEALIQASPHFAEAKKEGSVNLVASTSYTKVAQTLGEALQKPKLNHVPYQATKTNLEVSQHVHLKAMPGRQVANGRRDWTDEFLFDPETYTWTKSAKSSGTSTYLC